MQISANGISLEVEDHGSPAGEPLVLIMGLGMQLVAWHPDFVAMLVARGFRVIRFDNRDIGLSQRFDHLGVPNLALDSLRFAVGMKIKAPYTVADMADDTAALLAAMGIPSAHICGASMGGMIAQQLAVRHPQRVKSLTLIMTSSGARSLPGPSLKVRSALISRPADPKNVQSVIEHYVKLYRLIGSPDYPAPEAYLQERLGQSVRRSYRPAGTARQMVAIAADGNRSPLLGQIRQPTQIIHGKADPLVPVEAGIDLGAKIAGAEIDLIPGMGHDLPTPLWPRFVAGIAGAARRA
ncbi:alpha/beta hydrolase [Rhizobacter sp. Root404]|jgi:pimeloyl-ACP methyl ester carboxylesterase|uniref:alpha/beta hydrolase n=1 Tax=Rhizobacter sp. Root404 TaxID=1736528 RepID=UPI0006F905D8|nr:alpha/beta hydrolase [Rhizobacter sp. Root404]KQW36647.1 alpha/beta hydrolase [Rhizobacter sp. Root404]